MKTIIDRDVVCVLKIKNIEHARKIALLFVESGIAYSPFGSHPAFACQLAIRGPAVKEAADWIKLNALIAIESIGYSYSGRGYYVRVD